MSESWSKRWNIWRIKSPWIRLPLAWLYVVAALATFGVFLVAMIIAGAFKGALGGFDEWREICRWPGMWSEFRRAMTKWKLA